MTLQQPIVNPCMPYDGPILGGLSEGKMIIIQGCVLVPTRRFAVNLTCGNGDIAFHFNPRFDQGNTIVCNSLINGTWGTEEIISEMPFQPCASFEMVIKVRCHGYQVSVNGNRLLEYCHRLSMHQVQKLQINGDISLRCIYFSGGINCGGIMVYNPATPFCASLSGRFVPSSKIIVAGCVPCSADRFQVDLKNSSTGNTALHINPRLKLGTLVRNSFINGAWGDEEKCMAFMPFSAGQTFQMEIIYLQNCYQVTVNGMLKFEYNHRIPACQVDQLEIGGDVTLSCVQY